MITLAKLWNFLKSKKPPTAAVKFWRDGSDNHEYSGVAVLVESMIFSPEKALALDSPAGILPDGWWVGSEILDDDVWEKIKSGEYRIMSHKR